MAALGLGTAFVFWPLGLLLSLAGLRRTSRGRAAGRGLARLGVAVSCLAGVLWVALAAVAVVRGQTVDASTDAREASGAVVSPLDGMVTLAPDPLLMDAQEVPWDLGPPEPLRAVCVDCPELPPEAAAASCEGLSDIAPAVPPRPGVGRPRSVSGAVLVQDNRTTPPYPSDAAVTVVLSCQGTATWEDGGRSGILLELTVDPDNELGVSYRRLE